jgi:GSCFA family
MMSEHPYRQQPTRAFWSRAVADSFTLPDLNTSSNHYFGGGDRIVTAGSCFAANLIPYIEASDAEYVRTEVLPEPFASLGENLGYATFSAAYGNIYTPLHLRQLLERAYGSFTPAEDRWHEGEEVIDPFRPGLRYPAGSDLEFDLLSAQHLAGVRRAVEAATVFVFTLGLTEAWASKLDGAVYPGCPGTIRGTYDPGRHEFVNFMVADIRDDLERAFALVRSHSPGCRFIVTVSPVPLVATATDEHVLVATTYSKSVLRAAAGELAGAHTDVRYFPAYEIVTGPQAPYEFFEPDRREVSKLGVQTVMSALFGQDLVGRAPVAESRHVDEPATPSSLAERIAQAACDEIMSDW